MLVGGFELQLRSSEDQYALLSVRQLGEGPLENAEAFRALYVAILLAHAESGA